MTRQVLLLALVLLWLLPAVSEAQEEKSELFLFYDIVVHPSKVLEFETAIKKQAELLEKHQYPYPWLVASTNDFHYYFATPVDNYAAVDTVLEVSEQVAKEIGADFQAVEDLFEGTIEAQRTFFFSLNRELSYKPENPRLQPGEVGFIHYTYIYYKPGSERVVDPIIKRWRGVYASQNIRDGYDTWVGQLGTESPVHCFVDAGKDAADFFSHSAENRKLISEEAMELDKELAPYIKRIVENKRMSDVTGRAEPRES
jgi:hypothetical protein